MEDGSGVFIMKQNNSNRDKMAQAGFTMMEVIAVLIIMGIVAAMVIARNTTSEEVKLQTDVDTLKGHLRLAQHRAMNELPGTKWGIQVSSSSYTLVRVTSNAVAMPQNFPGESSSVHSFSSTVAVFSGRE